MGSGRDEVRPDLHRFGDARRDFALELKGDLEEACRERPLRRVRVGRVAGGVDELLAVPPRLDVFGGVGEHLVLEDILHDLCVSSALASLQEQRCAP